MTESDESAMIDEVTRTISRHEHRSPRGWLGPWISESPHTPDLLQEAGYRYLLDWCCDDQPIWMKTRSGRLLAVPYPEEINDIPAIAVRRASAAEFAGMIISQFEEMLAQSKAQPLVCGIALHPYIVGQPFRLRHLRLALKHIANRADSVWLCRPGEIAAHAEGLPPGVIPG